MEISTPTSDQETRLVRELVAALGEEHVLTSEEDRRFFSQDIYYQADHPAAVVVRPGDPAALARAVMIATRLGHAVVPRGGGASYTAGYVPARESSVLIDTRRLDRIVEVSTGDMYVTVECGCTWKKLRQALEPHRVRTPFWGPLSGAVATVGGSLSQNSILWGSSLHGASPESVLALEVVLADGTLLPTGSAATRGAKPFFRHYGPDLTGLFLGDAGALGIKARATLRLTARLEEVRFASFSFDRREELVAAMLEIARRGLASECFGMDPELQRQRLKRTSLGKDLKALRGVATGAGSVGAGLKEAARVALAGRRFVGKADHSLHVCVEGRSGTAVEEALAEVRNIGRRGREVENTIPKVLRGDPFVPMTSGIGPEGERWAPIHGVLPPSDAAEVWNDLAALVAERRESLDRLGIVVGFLVATVATSAFVLEPVFYWPGPRTLYYRRVLSAADLARFREFEHSPEAEALVGELRAAMIGRFSAAGAAHLQIGKVYPYRQGRDPAAWALLAAVKQAVDPRGLMNPGALGL